MKKTPVPVILIYVLVLFAAWTVRATVLYPIDQSIGNGPAGRIYSAMVMFCLFALPVFLFLRFYEKRTDPFRYLRLTTPVKPAATGFGLAAIALYFSGVLAFSLFVEGKNLNALFEAATGMIVSAFFRTLPAALFEEILFRGFLLGKFGERLGFWPANLLQAFLFAAIHLPHWFWSRGLTAGPVLTDFAGVFILGLFLGYLLKKTGTLWFCVGAHLLNNFWAGFLR